MVLVARNNSVTWLMLSISVQPCRPAHIGLSRCPTSSCVATPCHAEVSHATHRIPSWGKGDCGCWAQSRLLLPGIVSSQEQGEGAEPCPHPEHR